MALQMIIPSKTGTNTSATLCAGICCRGGGGRRARQGAAGKPAAGWAQRGGVCAGGCGSSARRGPGAGSTSAALLRRAAPAALPLLLARTRLPGALLELYCHSSSLPFAWEYSASMHIVHGRRSAAVQAMMRLLLEKMTSQDFHACDLFPW